jgi:hypothetical protein
MLLGEASKLKKEALEQGLQKFDVLALEDQITRRFDQLQRSVAWQRGGVETYDNYADSAKKIALMLIQKGIKPKEAVERAYEQLVGFKYEFEDGWRVPKAALGGSMTTTSLRDGAVAARYDIGSEPPIVGPRDEHARKQQQSLLVPRAPAGVRPEDAERQWRDTIRSNGFWVTSPGDGGLTLYVKSGLSAQPVLDANGQPVRRTWAELSALGTAVRASFSDVYRQGVRKP